MKEVKPTRRDVSKILGRRVDGWNDKRRFYNRIKLTERLAYDEMQELETQLDRQFPGYRFAIGNVIWYGERSLGPVSVTAINYWKQK